MTRLIHGRALLTGRLDEPEIAGGGVLVDGTTIVEVGPAAELRERHRPDEELGGADRIVMPGLVDAHHHAYGTSSVQMGIPDRPVEEWIPTMLGMNGPDAYEDASYMAAKLIAGGVTTSIYSHFPHAPDPVEETAPVLRAFADAGMRLACGVGFMDRSRFVNGDDEPFIASLPAELQPFARAALPEQDVEDYLAAVAQLRRERTSDRERILLGPAGPRWTTESAMERIAAAIEPGLGLHMHLLDGPDERPFLEGILGRSVFAWLDEIGALTPQTSMAHLMFVGPEDVELLAARGVTAISNTAGNIRLGVGVAPMGALVHGGVHGAVGTDDLTFANDDDFLDEVRLMAMMTRLEGRWLSAAQVLHMATAAGAHAALFGELTGTLEAGKRADVVLLDAARLDEPALLEDVPAVELVMAKARSRDVRTVLIDGEVVYADGRHLTIDLPALLETIRGDAQVAATPKAAERRRTAVRLAERKLAYLEEHER